MQNMCQVEHGVQLFSHTNVRLSNFGVADRTRTCMKLICNQLPSHSVTATLVGREGVEPPQSQTADLQSVGLATCPVSPIYFTYILIYFQSLKA